MSVTNHLAPRPPMGWNSFDAFACRINEAQFRAQAQAQADRLLAAGYEYAVIDAQWQFADLDMHGLGGQTEYPAELDAFGRVIPSPRRFPSCAGGVGFKPLADYVHGLGLKFGLHLMRGISRDAVRRNLPIEGTSYRAQDVADTNSTCIWNRDMYGVDMSKPGAQAYYDSLLALHAGWEVDFLKIDDIGMPYRAAEIEAYANARDRCGRDILLSLSPGHMDPGKAEHVKAHCEMWRISNDVWDDWERSIWWLMELVDRWSGHAGPGHWPDIDMLPFGHVGGYHAPDHNGPDRPSRMSVAEQQSMMTLAAITQSPLMIGADLTRLDDATCALLTNPRVLAINQTSVRPRTLRRQGDRLIWISERPGGGMAVGAVNVGDQADAQIQVTAQELGLRGPLRIEDAWTGQSCEDEAVCFTLAPHHSALVAVSGSSMA